MNGIDDESFIHIKAVKIGSNNDDFNDNNIDQNKHEGRENGHLRKVHLSSIPWFAHLQPRFVCYQYKEIQMSSRSLLEAAFDHYMQVYELATVSRVSRVYYFTHTYIRSLHTIYIRSYWGYSVYPIRKSLMRKRLTLEALNGPRETCLCSHTLATLSWFNLV